MEDELYDEAKATALEVGFVTVSSLQRRMRIGYTRAGRLVDMMCERGFCEKEPCDQTGKRNLIAVEQRSQADLCWRCHKPMSEHSTNRVGHEVCP